VEFIRRVGKAKGLPASIIENAGGRVCFFGSFALGVHNPGSDIDTLVVAPKHVNLMDFFDQFPAPFHEMTPASEITEFTPVPTAAVPIFKITLRGVNIDLLFVSLPGLSRIDKDLDLLPKSLIRGLDEAQIRSINGTRTVQELLDSVPQPKPFRLALRAVKLWAKRKSFRARRDIEANMTAGRGIYGNVFGYPGGIAWAIMVARICQLYPFACGSTILVKFFNLMGKWHWPRPVMLKHIEEVPSLHLKVWNPTVINTSPDDIFSNSITAIFRRSSPPHAYHYTGLPLHERHPHDNPFYKGRLTDRV
jgi:poly(A) polymerase